MKKILTLFILLVSFTFVYSNIRNVPGSYSTIQAAINACSNADTVLVAAGTYFENINFRGKKIVLTSGYYVNNDPSIINSTIINGSTPVNPDTGSVVIFDNNEDSTTVLQGFTITGGTGTKWLDPHSSGTYREGGGIIVHFCSPVIKNNIIRGNSATNLSGGMSGAGGGGLRLGDGNPKVIDNVIIFNTGLYGAGVVLNFVGCTLKNNVICSNYGSNTFGGGAGIWVNGNFSAPKIIENNTICYNSASSGTGGIYMYSSSISARNDIIWENISTSGGQISGSATVTYSDVQGGITGAGNINVIPQFSDTNYILLSNSPCVDAGDSSIIYNDPQDSSNPGFAKYPSRGTLRNDMGAYGGLLRMILSSALIGIKTNNNQIPGKLSLEQNYPNPFNPSTKINFDIPLSRGVPEGQGVLSILKIHDILGREVATLVNSRLPPGTYEIIWYAPNYPSGVYIYTLTYGDNSITKKMILLK